MGKEREGEAGGGNRGRSEIIVGEREETNDKGEAQRQRVVWGGREERYLRVYKVSPCFVISLKLKGNCSSFFLFRCRLFIHVLYLFIYLSFYFSFYLSVYLLIFIHIYKAMYLFSFLDISLLTLFFSYFFSSGEWRLLVHNVFASPANSSSRSGSNPALESR